MLAAWFFGWLISILVVNPILYQIIDSTTARREERNFELLISFFWFLVVPVNMMIALHSTICFWKEFLKYKVKYTNLGKHEIAEKYCQILKFIELNSMHEMRYFRDFPKNDEESFKIQISKGVYDFTLIRFIGIFEDNMAFVASRIEDDKQSEILRKEESKNSDMEKKQHLSNFESLKKKVSGED